MRISDWSSDVCSSDLDVLLVVGRRTDARELHARMPKGTRHLSALMCGAHRSVVIAEIRADLQSRRADPELPPVRVVSTQLIEAGVEIGRGWCRDRGGQEGLISVDEVALKKKKT